MKYIKLLRVHIYIYIYIYIYGTVQAQVYTRARVKSRALACRGVRALRVLGKNLTRENQRYVRPCVSLVYR